MNPKNNRSIILCNKYYTDVCYALTHLIIRVLTTMGPPSSDCDYDNTIRSRNLCLNMAIPPDAQRLLGQDYENNIYI